MLIIRLYITVLTLAVLVLFATTRGIGLMEAAVIVCPILYLILDLREELQELHQLEERVTSISSSPI